MYSITKDGARIALLENVIYIRRHPDGFYVLADKGSAEGVMVEGVAYALEEGSLGECPLVTVTETDGGAIVNALQVQEASLSEVANEATAAARAIVRESTEISDEDAVTMPHLFSTWEEVLAKGALLSANRVLRMGEVLYRVVQSTTPQAHYPPNGEGMLALYRPIDVSHAGTKEDPIPWRYGMDCHSGLYYSYAGALWLCEGDMIPSVWEPGTTGVWQWTEVKE